MTKESFWGNTPRPLAEESFSGRTLCTSLLLNDLVSYALPIASAM